MRALSSLGRELAGTNMTDAPHMMGVIAPDELAMLDRVLGRLSGRLILSEFAKDEAATLAVNLSSAVSPMRTSCSTSWWTQSRRRPGCGEPV